MNTGFPFPRPRAIIAFDIFLVATYLLSTPAVLPFWLIITMQAVRFSASLMVVIVYGWSLKDMWHENKGITSNGLIIGIFIAFLADLIGSIMGIFWRINGQPTSWTLQFFWQLPTLLTTLAAIHHIAVPDAINGRIPKRSIIWIGLTIGIAAFIVGIVVGYQLAPAHLGK